MNCKNCGSDIPDDAQFCTYCGEVLELEEKSPIETPIVDKKLEKDFSLVRDWVTENTILRQGMRTKIYLQVAKLVSSPVYGAEVHLSGPPQVEIVIKSRKIHPRKIGTEIFFPISAKEPGLFTLTATLTSSAGHRIVFPFKIRVEPLKTLFREEKLIKTTINNISMTDFNIYLDWVTETSVLHQNMRTKFYLQVEKLISSPVYGAEIHLAGPPEVDIVIKSRKIHPKKSTNTIFFPISAREPGLFTLTATLTSDAGHRIALPIKIRVEPSKTLYREEKPKKTIINDISMTDFMLYLKGNAETVFLHQFTPKNFSLIVSKHASFHINYADVQLSGPPHVEISIRSKKIEATRKVNRLDFTITAKELGVSTLTATLTSDAGHRIEYPFKIRVEPTNFIYGDSPTIDSSSEPDFKLSLKGGDEIIFLHQDIRKNFYLIVEKNFSSPVYGGEVQLSGPPHVDIVIQSRKIQANIKKNLVSFTISAKELGVFTLTATLTSDAGHQIEFPFKIRVEPTNFVYGESPTISSSAEPDFKLYLDGGVETVFLHQKMRKKFFLNIEKNISSPVYGGEVQLSGPPHVDIIIQSRKIQAKKKKNLVFFTISPNELGNFTLTATITSDAGHHIVFPIKIRVEPTNFNYVEEPRAKQAIHSTPTPSTNEGAIAALIIFGLIGGLMLLSGILLLFGGSFTAGITLIIIGFIICSIVLCLVTEGECCGCCI